MLGICPVNFKINNIQLFLKGVKLWNKKKLENLLQSVEKNEYDTRTTS